MIEYTVKVYDSGSKAWYLNDKLHREDGPAVEDVNGNKYWYVDGVNHREDGPAIEYNNGTVAWCLDGVEVTEKEHKRRNNPVRELTVEEISKLLGYEVKVIK